MLVSYDLTSLRYVITIHQNSSPEKPLLLGAFGFHERDMWWEHLKAVTTVPNL